jgi:hypothetical protein
MFTISMLVYDRKTDVYATYDTESSLLAFKDKNKAVERCSYLNSYYSMPEIRFMVKEV